MITLEDAGTTGISAMSDQYNITLFIRTWFITAAFVCGPILVFTGISRFLFYGFLASLGLALITFVMVSLAGNSFGNLLFGVGDTSDSGKPFGADIDRAKHFLRQKNMVQVKQIIDDILEKVLQKC